MNEPVRTLLRAGAEASMLEDFRALAEATAPEGMPRYAERPLLEALARVLVGEGGGPNRDAAIYELCHLVNAVDASGDASDRRNAFFMAPERATPARFRIRFNQALRKAGWRRAGFTLTDDGVTIRYTGAVFTVRFGRMPFLAALYEFLAGMEGFAFYAELQTVFDEMTQRAPDMKSVQGASNRIASHLRQYRRRHLARAQQEGKFDTILHFLTDRSPTGRLSIDDAAVLDFWAAHAAAGDFRAYRTVFDAFVNFMRALDEVDRAQAVTHAHSIGLDRDAGEIEPVDTGEAVTTFEDWTSPLAVLDDEPVSEIKFLKQEGERKPIELLMRYGPNAIRLPLAFLRLEAFGPVQSAITTDLQVGRGHERVAARINCDEARSYHAIVTDFARILEIIRRLQKAAFYVLHKDKQGPEPDDTTSLYDRTDIARLTDEASKAFRSIARKGFDEAGLADKSRIEGFRRGVEALVAAAAQLERTLAATQRLRGGVDGLNGQFETDRGIFSERFRILYGVAR